VRHRGGRAARARVAAASAGGDASAPVIVGMGSAGVDYLASIAAFPEPDAKLRTDSFEVQGGGNCGNALTATARLGCRPRILTKLSDDGAGKAIVDEFEADGVDTSAIVIEKGASSPFTYIIVDRLGATRTCIHTPGPAFAENEIDDEKIVALLTGASLAYFDGRLTEVAIKVATQAREMGIPVLVEGERIRDNLETLLKLGDHVCTSAGYPKDATGEETTETAMVKMLAELPNAKTLVTTLGSRGAVMVARVDDVLDETTTTTTTLRSLVGSLEAEAKAKETKENKMYAKSAVPLPAVPATSATVYLEDAGADAATKLGPVRVTFAPAAAMRAEQIADTTGAGDSFIGSFCFGVATGMALPAAMRLGAYVAARKCTALGARPGLPRRDTVPEELFLEAE
jgi:sugar/nucleoside kinase (ribokinase family)